MHIVAGAVIPACVKEAVAPASTGFRFAPLLFCAGSALFVRLLACLVSHNCISWSICFLFRLSTHPCGGRTEPSFVANPPVAGKHFVAAALAFSFAFWL